MYRKHVMMPMKVDVEILEEVVSDLRIKSDRWGRNNSLNLLLQSETGIEINKKKM